MAANPVGKLNFRISATNERRLREAAQAANQTLTDFVLSAAQAKADELLERRTIVPADYFDRLLSALDEPAEPIEQLARAARRERSFVQH